MVLVALAALLREDGENRPTTLIIVARDSLLIIRDS